MTPEMIEQWARECIAADWTDHVPGYYRDMDLQRFASLAFAAGAEAMRRDAAAACDGVRKSSRPIDSMDSKLAKCAIVIRALPLPKE